MALLDFPHLCRGQLLPETADVSTGSQVTGNLVNQGLS